jgi:exodeoxyribonuclease-3
MRIMTINTNGIRAAARKGFFEWLPEQHADVVCIQETKAQIDQLADPMFHPEGYHCYYYDAQKKGYSGTALYTRREPDSVDFGLGWEHCDSEGRWLQVNFDGGEHTGGEPGEGGLSVISLYLPSGSSSDERQQRKYVFMDQLYGHLARLAQSGRQVIICADWNICHQVIDLKNWKANQKNSGFLPDERAWLDRVYGELGYRDSFRLVNQEAEQYTWWSNRGQAWAKNVGWRLDYQMVTHQLRERVLAASIYKEQRFSDHAPLIMDYDL